MILKQFNLIRVQFRALQTKRYSSSVHNLASYATETIAIDALILAGNTTNCNLVWYTLRILYGSAGNTERCHDILGATEWTRTYPL
jgi:hypothetical protein